MVDLYRVGDRLGDRLDSRLGVRRGGLAHVDHRPLCGPVNLDGPGKPVEDVVELVEPLLPAFSELPIEEYRERREALR
jgi:hypothetical protein